MRLAFLDWRPPRCKLQVLRTAPLRFQTRQLSSTARSAPPSDERFRHLLYGILRQLRHFPDPAARKHLAPSVLDRFRNGRDADQHRRATRLRQVKKELSVLQRANQGERAPMVKVLMLTYGRTGQRRRELLEPLLALQDSCSRQMAGLGETASPEIEPPPHQTDPLHDGLPSLHPDNHSRVPMLPFRLKALLLSQQHVMDSVLAGAQRLRSLKPSVSEQNKWKRQMPQNRQINAAKSHYRNLLKKTLPPLPSHEWESLRRLAVGIERPSLGIARVESQVIDMTYEQGGDDDDMSDLADVIGDKSQLQRNLHQEKKLKGGGTSKPHHITQRFMQRLWAEVFALCPCMDWDVNKRRWQIVWGVQALREGRSKDRVRNNRTAAVIKYLAVD